MAKSNWNPADFHHWYERSPCKKRERALMDLTQGQKRLYNEWKIFKKFASVSRQDIDPRSIEMCDPNAATPPLPDVRCLVSGREEYFELGEVTGEALARAASIANMQRHSVHAGVVSQRRPLVRIFLKKCRKRYTTNGCPLHLILHFTVGRQAPFEPQIVSDVQNLRASLVQRIRLSQFSSVWLYDDWQQVVLGNLNR